MSNSAITIHTPPAPAASAAGEGERFHGLDWLRGIAALLVVALHAGIAYTLAPLPGLAWPTHDPHPSPFVDALTWWIDGFIMPLFLLLGGFVAAQLFLKRGPDAFLRHRARRLLAPLLFGCVVILPLDLYVWLLGWAAEGKIPLKKLRSLKLGDAGEGLWGVGHLWFLEYLFLFCVAAWAAQRVAAWWTSRRITHARPTIVTRSVSEGLRRVVVQSPRLRFGLVSSGPRNEITPSGHSLAATFCLPFLLAVPSAVALWWEPRIVIGFRHSWHPLAANLLYYAPCFAGGWWLYHRHRAGSPPTRCAPWHLALSILCFAALLPLIREHVVSEFTGPQRVALTALFAGFAWLSAVGWFGLCLRRFPPPPRAVQYLSAASLWVYLFHHPVVGLTQVALAGAALPAAMKFVIVTATGIALSLLTYEAAVRSTWVGVLLNGRRESGHRASPAVNPANHPAQLASSRRAA
jgi:peptidoglycan/LPS O-acetylase OafA/YrhL